MTPQSRIAMTYIFTNTLVYTKHSTWTPTASSHSLLCTYHHITSYTSTTNDYTATFSRLLPVCWKHNSSNARKHPVATRKWTSRCYINGTFRYNSLSLTFSSLHLPHCRIFHLGIIHTCCLIDRWEESD